MHQIREATCYNNNHYSHYSMSLPSGVRKIRHLWATNLAESAKKYELNIFCNQPLVNRL